MNIFTSLKHFLCLSRVFPASFMMKSDSKIRYSVTWSIYSILVTSLLCFTVFMIFVHIEPQDNTQKVWITMTSAQGVLILIQIVFQITKRSKIVEIISLVYKFDKSAKKCGIFMEHRKEKIHVILRCLSVVLIIFYNVVKICSMYLNSNRDANQNIGNLQLYNAIQVIFVYFFVTQLSIFLSIIKMRFGKTNEYLEFILNIRESDAKHMEKFWKFYKLQYQLCAILRKTNETITLITSPSFLSNLLNIVFTTYGMINYMLQKNQKMSYHLVASFTWALVHITLMIMICHAGESLTSTAEKSERIILRKICSSQYSFTSESFRTLYCNLKLLDRKVQNVFFTINWKLGFAVIFHFT